RNKTARGMAFKYWKDACSMGSDDSHNWYYPQQTECAVSVCADLTVGAGWGGENLKVEKESFRVHKIPRVTASRALCGGDRHTWSPFLSCDSYVASISTEPGVKVEVTVTDAQ
ncbi:LOW QUALITY PROTEIN: hypothetical protein U0070_000218, partial [Myodes glareolus]